MQIMHRKVRKEQVETVASDQNILSWNFANWITVVLMAAIMFAILGIVQKYMQGQVAAPAANGGS